MGIGGLGAGGGGGFLCGLASLGLEGFEFGFVGGEFVFDAADVEGEEGEMFAFLAPGVGRGEGGMEIVLGLLGIEEEGEDAVFDGGGAVEAPDAAGDLADEGFFDGAYGLVVLVDAAILLVVALGFFFAEDEGLAGEAVA